MHAHDIEAELNLSFSEAANGCIKQVSFSAKNVCDSCDGRGYLANAKRYVCPSCKGLGRVSISCYFKGSSQMLMVHYICFGNFTDCLCRSLCTHSHPFVVLAEVLGE
uniref:CR-type domain-containing protein n=1 Tax=Arundo donax TaxID=35708 RepID=A0A0A9EH25_ARUDO